MIRAGVVGHCVRLTVRQANAGVFPFWRDVDAALSEWTNGGKGNWSLPPPPRLTLGTEIHDAEPQHALSDWSFYGSASDQGILQYFFGQRRENRNDNAAAPARVATTLIFPPYVRDTHTRNLG